MPALEINEQFKKALEILKDRSRNVFITGKAGSGKSTFLEYFAKNCGYQPVLLAPTGVAALTIKGQTIHSFFNFYLDVTPEKINNGDIRPKNKSLYKNLRTIIIDEISMVRADLLDCVDLFLRLYGPYGDRPFGGIQMVFVGDLYQLPPVVTSEEKAFFSRFYQSPYFFSAHVYKNFSLEIIELTKIYRQKDQDFVNKLNNIRINSVHNTDIEYLNQRLMPNFEPPLDKFYIHLTDTNKRADEINNNYSARLLGKTHIFEAEISGQFTKEYFPTAQTLTFKAGSQVMMLNNDAKKRYVNGTIGVIEAVRKINNEDIISIFFHESKQSILIERYSWEVFRFFVEKDSIVSESIGTFSQFPFRLAWAITIHKSQGKTFDNVVLDIGQTFAAGQLYVALSRCTTFEGLVLKRAIKKNHINADFRVHNFFRHLSKG
jgi:ATP-dependent exoDNAse (exonuclease V) alpha subunit